MRRRRVIDQLRAAYPGKWTYRPGELCVYRHESGREVLVCAALAPAYDGDDDTFETQVRWYDTGELALPGDLRRWRGS